MTALQDHLRPELRASLQQLAGEHLTGGDCDDELPPIVDHIPDPTTLASEKSRTSAWRRRRGVTVADVASPLPPPPPRVPTSRIPITVISADPISRAGVIGHLRPRPEVLLLDDSDATQAQVALVIADSVDEPTQQTLRALRSRGTRAVVLVASHFDAKALAAAVEHGVTGVVRRSDATPDRLVTVIQATAAGDGDIPADLLGQLLHQVGTLQRDVLRPSGLNFTGLRDREIAVLRLVADGCETAEIAKRLCYSPRTIKNILHDVTSRLHLRNRCHAVAYATRNGLI